MLKKIIDKLEDTEEKFRDLYEQKSDGKFHLKVEGDDGEELKRAKEHEVAARKEAERKLRESEERAKQLDERLKKLEEQDEAQKRKSGDVEALEQSWKKKLSDREAELTGQVQKLQSALEQQMVGNVASTLANELAGAAAPVLLPHIKSRLKTELGADGQATTRVLDEEGKPSAMSLEDLKNFFFISQAFAPIIVGSKANGSGANGGQGNGGAGGNKTFSEMSPAEMVALKRKDPEKYRRLRDEEANRKAAKK